MVRIIILFLLVFIPFYNEVSAQVYNVTQKNLPLPYLKTLNSYYGNAVSVDGDYAVIGAYGYNNGRGCAYVLHFNGSTWQTIAQLKATDSLDYSYFGKSVCISGDNIVVGAYQVDSVKGSAYVFSKPAKGWTNMIQTAKLTASKGTYDDFFGYSVSISGNNIVVGAFQTSSKKGAAYVFTKKDTVWTNMTETAKLIASDGASEDRFGYSVSISGDNIVIGALQDDENKGSAYVFTKKDTVWTNMTETAKLTASDGVTYKEFGCSVSISGDNIAVGANFAGTAYLYSKPAAGWKNMTETAKLTASDGANNDFFGYSVAISGDNVVVGAYGTDNYKGSAYVYLKPVNGWVNMTQTSKLTASDGESNDRFGTSVGITSDNVVVGAYYDNDNGFWAGSAYMYNKTSVNWATVVEICKTLSTPYSNNKDDQFGMSVSVDGNYAVIGSPGYYDKKGCAYISYFNGISWQIIAKLTASDGARLDNFGSSVSVSGDNVVVGAPRCNNDIGAAYIFTKPLTGWVDMTETAKLICSNGQKNDAFGIAVGISGDKVVIGGNGVKSGTGAAYIYEKPVTGWVNMTERAKITPSDATTYHAFGGSVSILNDNVVVAAYGAENYKGTVYVFTKPLNGWVDMTETAKLTASDRARNDMFGYSVGISGDNIVVGAIKNSNIDTGAVYVFTKPVTGWVNATETAKLTASDGSINNWFGFSASISGDNIVVGACREKNYRGSAYIFTKPVTGWVNTTETAKLVAADGISNESFGFSVSVSANKVIIGAYSDIENKMICGSVYHFDLGILPTSLQPVEFQNTAMVYPNPVKEQLNINTTSVYNQITIVNQMGQTVWTGKSADFPLNTSGFTKGVYVIRFVKDGNIVVEKFVKE
jgi:hypothetical protein